MSHNTASKDFKVNGLPIMTILGSVGSIDGTATGTTNLYTVPTGRKAVVAGAVIRVTAVTGFSVAGTAGIGVAAGEDDIFGSAALTGLSGTTIAFVFTKTSGSLYVAQSTDVVKLGIDTGFTATAITLAVDLFGYLL